MVSFSAVILTYNEEELIEDCLKTLSWCDEIIVVDGHSTDNTRETAEIFADKVLLEEQSKNIGFDHVREQGIEAAENDWIIVLDADERMPDSLPDAIQKIVHNYDIDVVKIPRKNIFFDHWIYAAGWWPDYQTRVFKRTAVSFDESLHSFINIEGGAKVAKLPQDEEIAILHSNYDTIHDWISGMNRYSDIEAKQLGYSHSLFLRGFKEFGIRFLYRGGYKLGKLGFAMSSARMFYWFVVAWKAAMQDGDNQ